mgnify:CR=1 FL=1
MEKQKAKQVSQQAEKSEEVAEDRMRSTEKKILSSITVPLVTKAKKEAKKKIDGLLSALFSEYESYSGLVNKTSDANGRNLAAASSRNEQMASLMDTAVSQAIDDGKSYHFKAENKEKIARMELADKISDGHVATKSMNKRLDLVEAQTKQFIGERQGAWELHYSNQEIGLRKKADKNKELLQLHQTEAQVPASSV